MYLGRMVRKSKWLPARTEPEGFREPGRSTDSSTVMIGTLGAGRTPLSSIAIGIFWAVGGIALAIGAVVVFDPANWPIPLMVMALLFLLLAAFQLRRGAVRWVWRRNNVQLTNGVYLRSWERTPAHYDR